MYNFASFVQSAESHLWLMYKKDGVKYEKELLDLADKLVSGVGDGRISKDDVEALFTSAMDGPGITEIEKGTLLYIRANYKFTSASEALFDEKIAAV